ncbi:hypothetical protein QYE76_048495 [Lolium multiflorum]|uniref:Uncharacterized protein n=1 Tax=Lolium multiflorum TaxID=4521 RepID=A0AAD8SNA3_LOLMU|nr:hypothetical protein QYE76_048495 [Lolium multiflorum]
MGKPRDTKVAILPSTTRKGTTLSTSAALDSPSVIDKLVSPPHASHAGTSAESENSYDIDNVSSVLDDSGSLGSFLDATIARSRQIENTETPNATTPVNSPELDYSSDDLDEDYVELNDDFIEKCNATTDARKIKKLLAEHARVYNFDQEDGEKLPEAWSRFCSLIRALPDHDLEKHDLLDIFYSGLTIESRAYLDSCAGCVFRKRTPDDAEELLAKIGRNHDDWTTPEPTPTPIVKKRGLIKLNDEDMREAKKSLKEKGNNAKEKHAYEVTTRGGVSTQDPLYPEGHPKRIEQDSQRTKTSAPSKKKKKKHKNVVESSEPVNDPNSISISDAETESGNEHDKDNDKNDTPDKEVEEEPEKHAKNKKYTKEDFIAEKHDMASSINFNQFLEKEKLKSNGSNFTDWFHHVRIFLNGGNLQYVLDAPLGDPPAETETDEVKVVYATRKTRYSQVRCAILCSLEADLQKRFEHHDPHELINELKTIFETHAAVECYEASKHFFSCMMEEGSSNMNKELPELFSMLKSAEIEIKKEHQVLMVNKTTSFKKQGKSKGKNKKSGKKAATPPVKPKTALSRS